jgi:HPt (histidine-containing phosphotransfer) domain-containing protein
MDPLIDTARVVELEQLMKEPLTDLIAELVQSMDESIERARTALAVSDLDTTARAAHRFRNDALIVGAGPLQAALASLETSARQGESAELAGLLAKVEDVWSVTRPELLDVPQAR